MNTPTRIVSVALAAAALASPALPASASSTDVVRRGSCSLNADWKLKASPENGRIQVEGEVDSNKVGQSWNWRIVHNGSLSASGTATTTAPSGSFEVRRLLVNLAGSDSIVFRAHNPKSDETCRGSLTF
jgi:hypothetical protein